LLYYEIEARKPEKIAVKEAIGLHIAENYMHNCIWDNGSGVGGDQK
jgi:hypothetical protein